MYTLPEYVNRRCKDKYTSHPHPFLAAVVAANQSTAARRYDQIGTVIGTWQSSGLLVPHPALALPSAADNKSHRPNVSNEYQLVLTGAAATFPE